MANTDDTALKLTALMFQKYIQTLGYIADQLKTAGFELIESGKGAFYFSFEFGDGYELCFEPGFPLDIFYLALYQHQEIVFKRKVKIPVTWVDQEP